MFAVIRRLGIAAAVTLGLIGPALAHAHLEVAVPPVNAMVAESPRELHLKFSERLDLGFTGVTLTGPGEVAVPLGAAKLDAADGSTLVVPIPRPLAAGAYRVDWHALANDGHKTQGSYMFTVTP